MVVPYNLYLLNKYRELCGSIRSVKYLFKYVAKGTDRATLAVKDSRDEITRYVKARYVSLP